MTAPDMSLTSYKTLMTSRDEYTMATRAQSEDKVQGGYVDISSYQWVVRPNQPRRVRTPFLVTQCKRTARENDEATWTEGREQLERYMPHMVTQHPWRHQQYGIIAVGRYAEFYKWDAAKSEPVLYAGRFDILAQSAIIHEEIMKIREERRAGR
ncbi:hypothetical protein Aspvir_008599 [Aspergillus viridinutans]|uniref:Uncharacterized protein n=1 Tax=Aspergillus viridinutans TaxID=75553 RepID=A0A9P3C3D9_ASPVI|nr:uncharacterized protein Aspvir_008599 [Aspergillus viridinutans]GIK04516.1 hypothetical protein Aspvir_008599 [Aspergillus viridinutans]